MLLARTGRSGATRHVRPPLNSAVRCVKEVFLLTRGADGRMERTACTATRGLGRPGRRRRVPQLRMQGVTACV